MMIIDINDISPEGLALDISEKAFPLGMEDEGITLDGAVTGAIRITPVGKVYSISGQLSATAKGVCNRCLKPILSPVTAKFATDYHPAVEMREEMRKEHEFELIGEDLDIAYYYGEEIDTDEVVREQLLLAVPMQQVCREDCKGLCPHCGKNLNSGPCDCKVEMVDPRLAKLKDLLK